MIAMAKILFCCAIRGRPRHAIWPSKRLHAGTGRSLSTRAAEGERPVQRLKA
jgi:hypothetical protein